MKLSKYFIYTGLVLALFPATAREQKKFDDYFLKKEPQGPKSRVTPGAPAPATWHDLGSFKSADESLAVKIYRFEDPGHGTCYLTQGQSGQNLSCFKDF